MARQGAVFGIGPPIFGEIEPDALEPLRRVEIARPFPGGDGEMDFVVLRRDAELLRAAPGDRPHIGFFLIVLFQHEPLGGVDLGHRIGDFEIEDFGRAFQPLGMLGALEHDAAIGAFALEHAARIMQAVGEHADLALGRGNELAVEPDEIGALVEGHCHGIASLMSHPTRNLPRSTRGRLLLRGGTPVMVAAAL